MSGPGSCAAIRERLFQLGLKAANLLIQLFELCLLGGSRQRGLVLTADGFLLNVGEEGGEAVEVFGGIRIEFMVMALGTAHGGGQPHGRGIGTRSAAYLAMYSFG